MEILTEYQECLDCEEGKKIVCHKILLKENSPFVNLKNYRMDSRKLEIVKKHTVKLLNEGKIEESNSIWNSPILIVPKKNGDTRMYIDFRKINEYTISESCPPPVIEECLDALSGSLYFSTLDLESGYHQVYLDKKSRPLTAFTTPMGKFQYKTMPFELKNAPSHFQNLMYVVLQKFINKTCIVYMDDIIVFSKNIDTHYKDLRAILLELAQSGLILNFEKCKFVLNEVNFLGFIIKENTIRPENKKLEIFSDKFEIKNVKKFHSVLGLLNYYRNFIENFSKKVYKLQQMITKRTPFNKKDVIRIIEPICNELNHRACLDLPKQSGQFIVETDASNYGLVAVLKQINGDKELTIRFISRTLKTAELNYSIIDKEILAIIFALSKFKHYLGEKFIIRTDHKPIVYLKNFKNPQGRLARWILFLNNYDSKIQHIEGSKNNVADYLSRPEVNTIEVSSESMGEIINAHTLTELACPNITYLFLKQHNKNVPKFKEVEMVLKSCESCLKKNNQGNFKIHPVIRSSPFAMIGIDCIGPLNITTSGNRWIVLATDYVTGWCGGKAFKKKSAKNILKFLVNEIFVRHGPPLEIRSDMGKEFVAKIVEAISFYWSSKMKYTASYAPYSNGRIERANQTLICKLSKIISNYRNWDELLSIALFCYRISPKEKLKSSPFELLYGRSPNVNFNHESLIAESYKFLDQDSLLHERKTNFEKTCGIIKTKNNLHEKQIEKKNNSRKTPEDIEVNDIVLLRRRFKDNKLADKWFGPFIVMKCYGKGTYEVKSVETGLVVKVARKDVKLMESTQEAMPVILGEPIQSGKGGMWTNDPPLKLL